MIEVKATKGIYHVSVGFEPKNKRRLECLSNDKTRKKGIYLDYSGVELVFPLKEKGGGVYFLMCSPEFGIIHQDSVV